MDGLRSDSALPNGGDVDAMMEAGYNDIIKAAVLEARMTAHAECERVINSLVDADVASATAALKDVRRALSIRVPLVLGRVLDQW